MITSYEYKKDSEEKQLDHCDGCGRAFSKEKDPYTTCRVCKNKVEKNSRAQCQICGKFLKLEKNWYGDYEWKCSDSYYDYENGWQHD